MISLTSVDFPTAFLAGLAMFFTPCTLPLIPAWLSAVAGKNGSAYLKGSEAPPGKVRLEIFAATLFFVLGFSLVFTLLGAAAGAVGSALFDHRDVLRYLGAAAMAVFGLILLGILKPKALMGDLRLPVPAGPAGFLGAFLVGTAFAAGWTPCGGPILASLLSLAANESGAARGLWLLAAFSGGLAVPFLAGSLMLGRLLPLLKGLGSRTVWVNRALGLVILVFAALLALDKITLVTPDV
jgi:cytochrome c-type biogenesis protein